jgi:hypothetical protein
MFGIKHSSKDSSEELTVHKASDCHSTTSLRFFRYGVPTLLAQGDPRRFEALTFGPCSAFSIRLWE